MSMLLDAVQRQRSSEQNSDPALAVMLPQQPKKRVFPWRWALPFALAALGGPVGYGVGYWLYDAPKPQPLVEATPLPQPIQLAKRVALPLPVEVNPVQIETPQLAAPQPVLTAPQVSAAAKLAAAAQPQLSELPLAVETATAPAAVPSHSQPLTTEDPLLLAAFEQALADVGGVEPEPVTQAQSKSQAKSQAEPQPKTIVAKPAPETALNSDSVEPASAEPDSSLSPELQQALQDALQKAGMPPLPKQPLLPESVPKLGQLPWSFQKRLPDLEVTAHVYASEVNKRWLRANGRELQQGDEAAPGLTVKEILPNEIILEMDNQAFRIPALGSI